MDRLLGNYKKIDFKENINNAGNLIALEQNRNIPFDIKRVYYIFNTKLGVNRGFHAHKNLRQVLVCVSGNLVLRVDDGNSKRDIKLDNPSQGILIEGLVWREMRDISEDCVLLVLADKLYDEKDYIRDYDKFISYCSND